jgi:ADP-dependent NAD(P)H-hydrate dehydratase / NAD(P)H-hydrate epimerase
MNVVTVAEMQSIEKTANAAGTSYETMMQYAGSGVAHWIYHNLDTSKGVIGLIGSGNNGGDTLIALTKISMRGVRTQAFLARPREDDPLIETYQKTGGSIVDISKNTDIDLLQASLLASSILLDGILGTGFKLPLQGTLAKVMQSIASVVNKNRDIQVIAVDCPSGVDCDTGEASEYTLMASHTLTMSAVKQGLLHHPARTFCGEFHLIDIGIGDLSQYINDSLPTMIDSNWVKIHLPERPETGHKGTFGTCLILAGSRSYTGAVYLAGKGAYRTGCGLVSVATLGSVRKCLAGELIEAVWTILPKKGEGYSSKGIDILNPHLLSADSLVMGPGWGINPTNLAFLSELIKVIPDELPTLIDADGLKLLSQIDHWWEEVPDKTILTPHPGEMSVLTGLSVREIQSERWRITQEYAMKWGVVLLLKGAVTVIANPDGDIFVNPTSDTALATAGSGDVLSGMIGGLLAQGLDYVQADVSGAWLHGTAGLCAKEKLGTSIPITAMDILNGIDCSFVKLKEAG